MQAALTAYGVNMSRVQLMVATTDTIWLRDYGPRYIWHGDCRAIVDHTYNRPRPNDDQFPKAFAALKHHALYEHQLVHGGGNFHLDALTRSYATRLIANENPSLTDAQIQAIWKSYQNVDTTLLTPFRTSIDSTQHLDMWMQIVADNKVMISYWPTNPTLQEAMLCDQTAAFMQTRGYQVFRVPAFSVSGTHYTYTNVVVCNQLLLVPSYTNATVSPYNAQAVTAYQQALPGYRVTPINCESLITSAGAMQSSWSSARAVSSSS